MSEKYQIVRVVNGRRLSIDRGKPSYKLEVAKRRIRRFQKSYKDPLELVRVR